MPLIQFDGSHTQRHGTRAALTLSNFMIVVKRFFIYFKLAIAIMASLGVARHCNGFMFNLHESHHRHDDQVNIDKRKTINDANIAFHSSANYASIVAVPRYVFIGSHSTHKFTKPLSICLECVARFVDESVFNACIIFACVVMLISYLIDCTLLQFFTRLQHSEIELTRSSKISVALNLVFIFSCFDFSTRSQLLYGLILVSIQIISYTLFDIYRRRLKNIFIGSSEGYRFLMKIIFATFITSCLYLNVLLFLEDKIMDKYFLEYTAISNIRLILMNFVAVSVEIILNAIYPIQTLFFLRTSIGPLAEIFLLLNDLHVVFFLFKRSLHRTNMFIHATRFYYIIKFTLIFFKGLFYFYKFIQRIINQMKAERKFKKATLTDLKEYNRPCSICWEEMKEGRMLYCKHIFHSMCIKEWLLVDKTCPLCRKNCFNHSSTDDRGQVRPIFEFDLSSWFPFLPVIEIYQSEIPINNINNAATLHNTQAQTALSLSVGAFSQPQNTGSLSSDGSSIINVPSNQFHVTDGMINEVMTLFPQLSVNLVRQALQQTRSVATTVNLIIENQANFIEIIPETSLVDTPINNDNTNVDINDDINISNEEYQEIIDCNKDNYDNAFNISLLSNDSLLLDDMKKEMIKYSRKQYLLKNFDKIKIQEDRSS